MSVRVSRRPRPRRQIPSLAFVCALASLAVPAAASATVYTVTSTGDGTDKTLNGTCETTTVGECTFRAALEESNNSVGPDEIKFQHSPFEGTLSSTISPASNLPKIVAPVVINGDGAGQCSTAAGVPGPCVGLSGPAAGPGLLVENTNQVTIEGLAIGGVTNGTAIDVKESSEELTVLDSWIGLKLDGTAAAGKTGIFLDPNSNKATIGGAAAASRNVIANNEFEGLDIQGASNAKVAGNYFGVKPNGTTTAKNGKDIELTSSASTEAVSNEIGATVSAEANATTACDGGCNVIAAATTSSYGIDLYGEGGGEEPPAKGTKIHGNYIGLDAAGTGVVSSALFDVFAGKSKETTIGGLAAGDANHINGGGSGIYGSGGVNVGAPNLVIRGNLIGLNPAGTAALSPPGTGIFNSSENGVASNQTAKISGNRIAMLGGIAIEQHSVGANISGNILGRGTGGESLSTGTTGIKLRGSIGGSVLEGNVIEGAEANGVLVENENNTLFGNEIVGSGAAGVRIQQFGAGVLSSAGIGSDLEGQENVISGSGGDAIELVGDENTDTHILRNRGGGNAGLFIDLGKSGAGNLLTGPNAGIQAPVISKATTTGIGGTALPEAQVRVFEKATAEPGEIKGFLGKVEADEKGKWELTYGSKIAGGTNVGVTQEEVEGSSELALATTEPDKGGEEKGGGNNGKGNGATKDKTPPQTTIRKGPRGKIHKTTVIFKFVSSEAGSAFQCKLDKKPFKSCRSPKKYKKLKPGKHVFKVRAKDAAGNVDKTPAKRAFTVLR